MNKQLYCIVATDRILKKRVVVMGSLTEKEAFDWKPTSFHKKLYKYFRVAKYPPKYIKS